LFVLWPVALKTFSLIIDIVPNGFKYVIDITYRIKVVIITTFSNLYIMVINDHINQFMNTFLSDSLNLMSTLFFDIHSSSLLA